MRFTSCYRREPAGQREMNDPRVQQTIRQFLRESHAQLLKNAYFEMLHDQAAVRNYYAEQILKNGGSKHRARAELESTVPVGELSAAAI